MGDIRKYTSGSLKFSDGVSMSKAGWLNLPILRVLLGDKGQRDRETRTGLQCTVEKSI